MDRIYRMKCSPYTMINTKILSQIKRNLKILREGKKDVYYGESGQSGYQRTILPTERQTKRLTARQNITNQE